MCSVTFTPETVFTHAASSGCYQTRIVWSYCSNGFLCVSLGNIYFYRHFWPVSGYARLQHTHSLSESPGFLSYEESWSAAAAWHPGCCEAVSLPQASWREATSGWAMPSRPTESESISDRNRAACPQKSLPALWEAGLQDWNSKL
jgi:hypothetical protein